MEGEEVSGGEETKTEEANACSSGKENSQTERLKPQPDNGCLIRISRTDRRFLR